MHARILIVDDEIIVRESTRQMLKSMGYTVTGLAASGTEALASVEQDRPDLVLMDINLGNDHEGIAAAATIRERLALPVIYVTAHTDDATLERARITHPSGYVAKPFDERSLQIAIEVALCNHAFERQLRGSEERYRSLFDDSPIAIREQDLSEVKQRLDELRGTGVTDWRAHFERHPAEVAELAARVRLVAMNQKAIELLGPTATTQGTYDLSSYFTPESLAVFKEILISLAEGRRTFQTELPIVDGRGKLLFLDVSISVPSMHAHDLGRVLVSIIDTSARRKAEQDLRRQVQELRQFNELTVGRELAMIELKKQINALLREAGRPEEHRIAV